MMCVRASLCQYACVSVCLSDCVVVSLYLCHPVCLQQLHIPVAADVVAAVAAIVAVAAVAAVTAVEAIVAVAAVAAVAAPQSLAPSCAHPAATAPHSSTRPLLRVQQLQ